MSSVDMPEAMANADNQAISAVGGAVPSMLKSPKWDLPKGYLSGGTGTIAPVAVRRVGGGGFLLLIPGGGGGYLRWSRRHW